MEDLNVIVFTMKGCPYCDDFKNMLTSEGITYHDRDIDKYKDEYDMFVRVTNNEMVPAFMVLEHRDDEINSFLYAPERNYNELTDAVNIIKEHINNLY
jgi:glutaredoxin